MQFVSFSASVSAANLAVSIEIGGGDDPNQESPELSDSELPEYK
jgi:hypothetical protein